MAFQDLREWIEQARQADELVVLEGADTKYEMGTISAIVARNQGPAVLHQKIKGYPPRYGVITNLLSNLKGVNLTFGLPLENTHAMTINALRENVLKWEGEVENFPPNVVESGPILENVVEGDNIDLTKFPVPIWHELDGGPFIGTADAGITVDRDTGVVNMGTFRCQLFDRQTVGTYIAPGQHSRLNFDKYAQRGEPCPMVLLFGLDPLLLAISMSEIPRDISEFNYIGAIKGSSVPVVKGRTTGLPIPANAEIAIEGFIDPTATKLEGPFGEWPGHYGGGKSEKPFLKAETLYYRNDPILCGGPPSKGAYADYVFCYSIWRSALIYNELAGANVPGVKGVWCPTLGGSRHLIIIAIEQKFAGHAAQAGIVATETRAGALAGRYTIVVDDDVDIYDLEDVMWAVCSRSQPTDMDFIKKSHDWLSDPQIRRSTDSLITSRGIIYATKPYEWKDEFAAVCIASKEEREKALDKWKDAFRGRLKVS
jgi:UbiD family decarboxylase